VGDGVNVNVDSRVAVTEPGSGVIGFKVSVWVCLEVGEGADVAVRSIAVVKIGVGVLVETTGDGTLPTGVVGAKI
jgi:hypothetical protein